MISVLLLFRQRMTSCSRRGLAARVCVCVCVCVGADGEQLACSRHRVDACDWHDGRLVRHDEGQGMHSVTGLLANGHRGGRGWLWDLVPHLLPWRPMGCTQNR